MIPNTEQIQALHECRWDVFITHDSRTFAILQNTFGLVNRIHPADFPHKMQYGVKILVDTQFRFHDPGCDQLSPTSMLEPSQDFQAPDSLSLWSGSGMNGENCDYLYYTGISQHELAATEDPHDPKSLGIIPQRIFGAISYDDGQHWEKMAHNPLIDLNTPANLWYERSALDSAVNGNVTVNSACRDPFVFRATDEHNFFGDEVSDIAKGKYYMLFTARVNQDHAPDVDVHYRGCLGVACTTAPEGPFTLCEPLLNLGVFGDMELPHIVVKDRTAYLFFSVQDRCLDGSPSTDAAFAGRIGIAPNVRHCYGYVFDRADKTWKPVNERGGLLDTPDGVYGIRIFQHPDKPEQYGARGFFLPSPKIRKQGWQEFSLTPLMNVRWDDKNDIRITLPFVNTEYINNSSNRGEKR